MDLRDIKEFLKDTAKYFITAFVVIFIILYVATIQQVVGPSMKNTLSNRDIVLLSRIHYKFFDIKRFDVISFEYDDTKYLIKRVIGLPGEKIEYKNNSLYVNGKLIEEDYLKNIKTEDFNIQKLGYETIPDGKYLVLGDNRGDSLDSRSFGFIDENKILGKVIFKFWPIFDFKFL